MQEYYYCSDDLDSMQRSFIFIFVQRRNDLNHWGQKDDNSKIMRSDFQTYCTAQYGWYSLLTTLEMSSFCSQRFIWFMFQFIQLRIQNVASLCVFRPSTLLFDMRCTRSDTHFIIVKKFIHFFISTTTTYRYKFVLLLCIKLIKS